ncbi:site-specific DNA-methyltransferase [Lujinxingia litoralis]|uniref:Methyltransferase n=1 Tax=Lujinxingia litoralis TaxID=2211119 RepID=A0A328C9V2_9DELT|nr:site-specific DNA-methyltransferase [Lujinxingia litoralis]RAL24892.1 site-specific DNA-methyltransferase [Lujinxingia litoralis]
MQARAQERAAVLSPYYEHDGGVTLYKGDSLELLEAMEPEQFDMIFADPPYFLSNDGVTCKSGRMVSVNKGRWDRSQGVEENHAFNLRWLQACQRLLKPNGTMWVSGTHHVIFSIGFAMQSLGFKILNDIAWFKVNPPPNLSCRYFTHGTETVIWAGRDHDTRHTFNYKVMKEMNGGKQMKNLWNIMAPRKGEKEHGKHPTQKPIALLDRIVQAASNEGDLILDPFCGSSTTGVAALKNKRRYVGLDQNEEYLDLSIRRFSDYL